MRTAAKRTSGTRARAAIAAVVAASALGANFSCAAIWDIEDPLPLLGDGGLEAQSTDVVVDSTVPMDADAQPPPDTGRPDADGSVAETAAPDADAGPLAGAHGYTAAPVSPAPAFLDACWLPGLFNGVLPTHDDAATSKLPLPFPFPFYGVLYAEYWLNSNGVAGFSADMVGTPSNLPLVSCPLPKPLADPYPAIYAFADDLITRATMVPTTPPSSAGVCLALSGTAPNRRFVITWEDAQLKSTSSSHLTFSIVLYEATSAIDLMYGTMTGGTEAQGDHAVIGIADGTGTLATQFSCDMPLITSTPFDVRFTPNP
jgi:hypothetical protein